jgi:hypothetical protein
MRTGFVTILAALGGMHCLTASTFTVIVGGVQTSGPGPVGDVLGLDGAFSGNGTVKARSFVSAISPNVLASTSAQSAVSASEEIDDLVFSGPAATVETSLQLFYDAVFTVRTQALDAFGSSDRFSGAVADNLTVAGSLICFNCGVGQLLNGVFDGTVDDVNKLTVGREQQGSHIFELTGHFVQAISDNNFIGEVWAGVDETEFWGLRGVFDSGTITVPTNTPLTLRLNLSISETAVANAIANASAGVNASDTFGLPIGTPVFDLPAGFTANAPSIGLVNNVIPGSAAPEPMSMGLAAAGLAILGWRARRRRGGE